MLLAYWDRLLGPTPSLTQGSCTGIAIKRRRRRSPEAVGVNSFSPRHSAGTERPSVTKLSSKAWSSIGARS